MCVCASVCECMSGCMFSKRQRKEVSGQFWERRGERKCHSRRAGGVRITSIKKSLIKYLPN